MLFALIIRNYKTYQGTNYIPISKGRHFSALVGENGAGKSSVLEALNSYFNSSDWNYNHSLSKGFPGKEPFICPIFLVSREKLSEKFEGHDLLYLLNEIAWNHEASDYNSAHKQIADQFCEHRDKLLAEGINQQTHYLFPFGLIKESRGGSPNYFFSIFESTDIYTAIKEEIITEDQKWELHNFIHSFYKYIYLPSEIDFQAYTKIEGKTIQALLGRKIDDIVRGTIKKKTIDDINRDLNEFLEQVSNTLENYKYKKPGMKQNLFNQSHFTEKVIEAFFDSKVLTRIDGKENTPVNDLSSGEKRQALIDVARAFLLQAEQDEGQQTILAIDEPELSLHVSSCFEQFEKIKDITDKKVQSIITTHWYGFMPVISNGTAIYCPKSEGNSALIDLRCFRDEIKRLRTHTKGKLPADIELKGVNDLVQSIIASITGSDCRWIICEGSSDKVYLDSFFQGKRNLYILPVGGSPAVKKIYKYIEMALDDLQSEVKGGVFFLLDTDKSFEKFEARDSIKNIRMRRLQNSYTSYSTELRLPSDTEYYPPTVIENTLDATTFLETLYSLNLDQPYRDPLNNFTDELSIKDPSWPSTMALDLSGTQLHQLDEIFNAEGFKIKFALKYVELCNELDIPPWIAEIKDFLFPTKKKVNTIKRKPNRTLTLEDF
jgi:energy-coupling factor transporter ATP-binding protein EcfA2